MSVEESIKNFWEQRSGMYKHLPLESIVNLEQDPELLKLKIKQETKQVMPRLPVDHSSRIVDLGAGCGQWTFRLAPLVGHIDAVEYTEGLLDIARNEAKEQSVDNITFIHSAAEDFNFSEEYDLVFVSGLCIYLTDTQLDALLRKLDGLASGCHVFMRESSSVLPERYVLKDKFSEALQTSYSAIYRTRDEFISCFINAGFEFLEDGDMFPDGSPLNKFPETRMRFYSFKKS